MNENQLESTARTVGGKLEAAAGSLTGDVASEARDRAEAVAGKAQDLYGHVVDDLKKFASGRPLTALLSAAGLGIAMGFFMHRRR